MGTSYKVRLEGKPETKPEEKPAEVEPENKTESVATPKPEFKSAETKDDLITQIQNTPWLNNDYSNLYSITNDNFDAEEIKIATK